VPRLDLTSLRYLASLASVAAGVSLLLYVALNDDGSNDAESTAGVTPVVAATSAPAIEPALLATALPPAPEPTAVPTLPPGPPLVKGTAADCHLNWRFIDNAQQRWTVCLPTNLLYLDGPNVLPFELAAPDDWSRITRDFAVANEAWFLGHAPQVPAVDVLEPYRLSIDVIAPGATLEGCDPRNNPPGARGAVICSERYARVPADGEGDLLRFRALVPTHAELGAASVFSLNLTVTGYSVNWPLQERLFLGIVESLKPY
jgi:hypothetical protein